jgi:hypothetical protein
MNTNKLRNTERMNDLLKAEGGSGITHDGIAWARAALDPFHDYNVDVAGFPDCDNMSTITMVRNFQYELSKPAAAAGAWDAQIIFLPIIGSATFYAGNLSAAGAVFTGESPGVVHTYDLSTVNVAKADAGQILYPDSPLTRTNFSIDKAADTDVSLGTTLKRVVSIGIEVVDTTPVVSKSGSLTVYVTPNIKADTPMEIIDSAATSTFVPNARHRNYWLGTQSEAVKYPTSRQWEARRGCYLACGMDAVENPLLADDKVTRVVSRQFTDNLAGTALKQHTILSGISSMEYANTSLQDIPYSQCGVFLNGLHNDATFLVRTRIIYEVAPNQNSDMALLATPSPGYDVRALQLYSWVRSQLPVAVPVSDNASGDWFRQVLRLVEKYAPLLSGVLPGPLPIIGQTAGQVAGIVNQSLRKGRLPPKPKSANNQQKKNGGK